MPVNLIPCASCSHRIAPVAKVCPKCGAPNRWVHPEIQRFLDNLGEFEHLPSFDYSLEAYKLQGPASVQRGAAALLGHGVKALAGGVLFFLYGMVGTSVLASLAFAIG